MVLVDTDVLLIHFRYPRDTRFHVNSAFLSSVQAREPCITVYNLMEFLGHISFSMSPAKLAAWDSWLVDELGLSVVWPEARESDATDFFREEIYQLPFSKMLGVSEGMAFQDALIIALGERTPDLDAFVTWNARHFRAKTPLNVLTPQEYVQSL